MTKGSATTEPHLESELLESESESEELESLELESLELESLDESLDELLDESLEFESESLDELLESARTQGGISVPVCTRVHSPSIWDNVLRSHAVNGDSLV